MTLLGTLGAERRGGAGCGRREWEGEDGDRGRDGAVWDKMGRGEMGWDKTGQDGIWWGGTR